MRNRLAQDPHRPQYHFLPLANWMNDPNGLIQWRGRYHLFYQHNPNEAGFGLMHWGHAVSEDLVRWRDLPIALTPTSGTADEHGCWSGCAVDNDGTPTLVYTGLRGKAQLPCVATGDDDLITWKKHPGNPVIPSPPSELDVTGFRDHAVWREGATWYQIIGSGIRDVGGTALLYRSPDLIHWEYVHPVYVGDENDTGEMWECPDLFPLGGKHVLLISPVPLRRALYFVGTYADCSFIPEIRGVLDYGGHFYAPQTMPDDNGRRLMWGWLWEGRSDQAQRAAGWAGVLSMPRILTLRQDGSVGQAPAPVLEVLRDNHHRWTDVQLSSKSSEALASVQGDVLEINARILLGEADAVGLKVRCSPDGAEQTVIAYDRVKQRLEVDREHASLDPEAHRERHGGPLVLRAGEALELRVFLDRSVVEVFGNNRVCVASRIYPSRSDSQGVDAFAWGGNAELQAMDIWTMRSIWPDTPRRLDGAGAAVKGLRAPLLGGTS
jgi:beta-fructofuranosidase